MAQDLQSRPSTISGSLPASAKGSGRTSGMTPNRHNRPIASHFHSGGLEFSYLGQDLDEADGESEETIARITVRERTAEHLHDVLSGD